MLLIINVVYPSIPFIKMARSSFYSVCWKVKRSSSKKFSKYWPYFLFSISMARRFNLEFPDACIVGWVKSKALPYYWRAKASQRDTPILGSGRVYLSLAKNPLLHSQGLAVSNQRSAFSLNIKFFFYKKQLIKNRNLK